MAFETEAQLETRINRDVADNMSGDISAQDIRTILLNIVDSMEFRTAPPHALTRYAALRGSGAMPGDFTAADFLDASATSSTTQDITTPASSTDMVVGIAVPTSEGPLTAVAELNALGEVNQFASMIRGDFLPAVGGTEVTLNINGDNHYVYCTNATVLSALLGSIGYRLTQTAP